MHGGYVAPPMNFAEDLLVYAVEQMHLPIKSGEDPKRIICSRNGRGGIERRRSVLLANTGNQRAGKKIPRRGKERREALRLKRPRVFT